VLKTSNPSARDLLLILPRQPELLLPLRAMVVAGRVQHRVALHEKAGWIALAPAIQRGGEAQRVRPRLPGAGMDIGFVLERLRQAGRRIAVDRAVLCVPVPVRYGAADMALVLHQIGAMPQQERLLIVQAPLAMDAEENLPWRVGRGVGDMERVIDAHAVVIQLRLRQRSQVAADQHRQRPVVGRRDAFGRIDRVGFGLAPALIDPGAECFQSGVGPFLVRRRPQRHPAVAQRAVDQHGVAPNTVVVVQFDEIRPHAAVPHRAYANRVALHPIGRSEQQFDSGFPYRRSGGHSSLSQFLLNQDSPG
jgi:hypothetical protein